MPLLDRKGQLEKLLRGRSQGIFVAPFERGEIGPDLFTAACRMRLEGRTGCEGTGPEPATVARVMDTFG